MVGVFGVDRPADMIQLQGACTVAPAPGDSWATTTDGKRGHLFPAGKRGS